MLLGIVYFSQSIYPIKSAISWTICDDEEDDIFRVTEKIRYPWFVGSRY